MRTNRGQRPMTLICALILVRLVGTSPEWAADSTIPPIIGAGLAAYKSEGAAAAIKAWLKGSPLEGSKEAMSQVGAIAQVETFYGKYVSYQVLQQRELGSTTQLVYLIMNFEHGPLFAKMTLFKSGAEWTIVSFKFHTEADQVLPASMLANSP